jgi:hypothetical protein
LTGDVVNGGEVGFAVLPGGRSNADENGFSGANGFSGVGGIGDAAGFASGSEDFVEMLLVYGDNAGVKLGDAFGVDVRADYMVTRFRKARGSHQSHITTANDAYMQGETPM